MRSSIAAFAALLALGSAPAAAALLGPTPYLSQADSPFNPASFANFYLEDFEDAALNTPGLSVNPANACITGVGGGCPFIGSIDSVGNGGNPALGHSLFGSNFEILFNAAALGGKLPTAAGVVWTDGGNPIRFEAFDQNNVSLGVLMGDHADGSFSGTTAEDRFYGATNAGGISRLLISNPGATEIDHIQYGIAAAVGVVPEPANWALMLGGIGIAGATLRVRRRPGAIA